MGNVLCLIVCCIKILTVNLVTGILLRPESAGADASVSDISQNTGGHNLTSENAADISGGTADSSARYYTVKKGDSLMSISKAVYHTTAMIPEICNANQIENMDMIYEGQQLLLP